jgi:hypothetical protein
MQILHTFTMRPSPEQRRTLQALGIEIPPGVDAHPGTYAFVNFEIDEAHSKWKLLEELLDDWRASETIYTRFTRSEITTADYAALVGEWHCGYPQPRQLDRGYLAATYDLAHWCNQCGMGASQKAPFQMRAEPRWGRRSILQMHWVFDEFFVTPQAWQNVFAKHGVGKKAVLSSRGHELETVVQLDICEHVDIHGVDYPTERCARCTRTKYCPISRGRFPSLRAGPSGAIVRTREYFGSGGRAFKSTIISQPLAADILERNLRGASFVPVITDIAAI